MDNTEINPYWTKLEVAMKAEPPVIVPKGLDDEEYFESLRTSIRENATPPIRVFATVKEPGFPNRALGSTVVGYLLAKSSNGVGYWLVYEPDEDEYYCFWGPDKSNLGAYGVSGNPIFCWWD
ncbi:hypothetical protein J2X19_000721 [Rhodoferax ferrireducens]|uniref:DUF551 domain-containing protein n=1 Tax=Rhodoferax ferrireducens TaxID=192843 RepID=A0ABU2C404_9BURK|nr:hypothetical protein [Rhodoferax ferrireducens]MDR7376063.1 hypothetical protein [Rhodoferax ferrireducens]